MTMGDICLSEERSSPVGKGTLKTIVPSRLSSIRLGNVFLDMAALLFFRFQDADRHVGARAGMRVDGTPLCLGDLESRVAEMLADGALQLPEGKDSLHQPGGA